MPSLAPLAGNSGNTYCWISLIATTKIEQGSTVHPMPSSQGGLSDYRLHQLLGLIAGPLVFLVLLYAVPRGTLPLPALRVAAAGLWMAIWWMTEAIPIAATALLPLVLFPLLGIADISATAAPYANPLIFLFLGGFLIALGLERWGLHRRFALVIVSRIGARPLSVIVGFAVASAVLSMWVSNTATALMMLPIGISVIDLVQRGDASVAKNFAVVLMLSIAYSCSLGGMATLIGTPPNALFAGFMLESYERTIGFAEWMVLGLPLALVALPLMLFILTRFVYPIRIREIPGGRDYIDKQLLEIGSMSRGEKMVAVVFVTTAVLWVTRPLLDGLIVGLSDAGIAMAMALLLFILPVDLKSGTFLLDWTTAERLPWGVLLLFGGGLSLAGAVNDTGLADWIGSQMVQFSNWPLFTVILVVSATIVLLTELTSNTATTAAFLPVAASVAVGLGHDPLMLAIPAVLAASCAFMLPVATPPNAIIYGSSFITIPQMARAGIVLNVVFILLISLTTYLVVPLLFG